MHYSVAKKLASQGTSVVPPECSAHLQKASVLPPAPTVSSSRARIDREPEITAKVDASHEDEDSSCGKSIYISYKHFCVHAIGK
jgi:hypothetical protein